jgi:tetratricopeptide (TPR) repeat protein
VTKAEKKELVQTKTKIKAKPSDSAASTNKGTQSKSPEAPLVKIETIKRALADAKAKNDLLGPNFMAMAPELINTLTNPATAKECWSCVEQFQAMVDASKQIEDRAYAQALIARFAKITGREALAKKNYQASIAIMQGAKHEFKFGFDMRDIYTNLLYLKISERCKIALALISCKDKKVEDAEKTYVELMKDHYHQPWYVITHDTKAAYASHLDGVEGVAIISLAAALGKTYADIGQLDKAAAKFNELVELLAPDNDESMDEKDKNMGRLLKLMFALDINTGETVERSDPLIGPEISLEKALRAYLAFSDLHPELCKKEDMAFVKARVERLTKARLAKEKQEMAIRNFKPIEHPKLETKGSSKL